MKVILLFELLLDFGSLIKINGISDNEVITITTNNPSKKPFISPFSCIWLSTYLETRKPAREPVVRFAAKNIALCLYKSLETKSK